MQWVAVLVPSLVLALVVIVGVVDARRRGFAVGGQVVVRCHQGHLFTTVWLPGASLKAVRLGWFRIQRCPVGGHVAVVTPVRDADLTSLERRMAARYRDGWVP